MNAFTLSPFVCLFLLALPDLPFLFENNYSAYLIVNMVMAFVCLAIAALPGSRDARPLRWIMAATGALGIFTAFIFISRACR